jgi:endonuclease YncB( thermonuclease family)
MPPRFVLHSLVCLGLASLPLGAQDAATPGELPEELLQLRRQFEKESLTRAETLSQQFVTALANITRDAGAEGDYDQALAAQKRREAIVALYSKSLDDAALKNVILLKPSEASRNGSVVYDRNMNALVTWRTPGSIATWDKVKLTPGSYHVTVTYAAADIGEPPNRINPYGPAPDLSTGGEFEFYEDSSLPGADQNRRSGKVASTGGWTEWKDLILPPITITRTSARFALKITSAKGIGGVMNVKGIRLDPVTGATPAGAPATTAVTQPSKFEEELGKLQATYLDRLRQVVTPVVTSYAESLKSFAAKAETQDPAIAAQYQAEARRAAQIIDDPPSVLGSLTKSAKQSANLDGFHAIRDATFVPTERANSTGDRFKVKVGNEEFFVRLLWVTCPPPGPKEKLLAESAQYFGINTEDAQEIGKQAQNFTAKFLEGKPLGLLTRDEKDAEGNLLVSLRLDGVGDFAGVLVANGLAMVKDPGTRNGLAERHDNPVLHDLKEREKAAKARRIPPGAWARAEVK